MRFPVGAGNDVADNVNVMPDRVNVMPDLIGHLNKDINKRHNYDK